MTVIDFKVLGGTLGDLGQFGIHLSNPEGVCFVCGKGTRPYSDGMQMDSRCKVCAERRGFHDPIYTSGTVFVKKALSSHYPRVEHNAIVKIDGTFYEVVDGNVSDIQTGQRIRNFALSLPSSNLPGWWLDQGDTTTYAYTIQFYWPGVKEMVSHEVSSRVPWLNRISFYDIGHPGRGMQEEGSVYVRLYVEAVNVSNLRDFNLLAVQLVEAEEEAFLEGYEVAKFPADNAILEWTQAGQLLTEALLSVRHSYVTRSLERVLQAQKLNTERRSVSTNWWILLFLNQKQWRGEESHSHTLRDFLILSKD